MANKPNTVPQIWASNTNYVNGPFVGSVQKLDPGPAAAQGHRPGVAFPTPAEWQNFQQYWEDVWIVDWLSQGSSAGDADAHIVETNSTGGTALQRLVLANTNDDGALVLLSNSNTNPGALLISAGTSPVMSILASTATGLLITPTGPQTGIQIPLGGAAARGLVVPMTGSTAPAVDVAADAASNTAAIRVNHLGTGGSARGISVQTGAADAIVAVATAGGRGVSAQTVNSTAVLALSSSGIGVSASSTSGIGVSATSSSNVGVQASSTSGIAVNASSQSNTGISASSNTGTGLIASSADGGAAYFFTANGLQPTVLIDGGNANGLVVNQVGTGSGIQVNASTNIGIDVNQSGGTAAIRASGTSSNVLASTCTGSAAAISANNSGTGPALLATAAANHALRVQGDQTSPTFGEMSFAGQDARPSNTTDGQLQWNSTELQFTHTSATEAASRGMWSTRGGFCRGFQRATAVVNGGLNVYTNFPNLVLSVPNAPKVANRPIMAYITLYGSHGSPNDDIDVAFRVRDVTANVIVFTELVRLSWNDFYLQDSPILFACSSREIIPPAAGARTYRIEAANWSDNAVVTIDATFEILGQY